MKILIIDDHPLFLDGVTHAFRQKRDDLELLAIADPLEAMQVLEADLEVELVLLDINMPRMNGIAFLSALNQRNCTTPVVAVSATDTIQDIVNVLDAGAVGFIPKSYRVDDMLVAIEQVLSGNIYIPESMQTAVARLQVQQNAQRSQSPDSSMNNIGVTRRQREVLKLVAEGNSNKDIALHLHLTEHTVKSHLSALFQLLHAKSRSECVQNAYKIGLIKLPN